ncbi:MAG: hypothetical protein PHP06_08705 [Clostridia bacterium]|nr:hypothetical protein [Clostridia bacterium]
MNRNLLYYKYNEATIKDKRKNVYNSFMKLSENIKDGTITRISTADLKLLFELYDNIFFDDWFKDEFTGKLKFSLSKRMIRSAGLTLCPKNIKPENFYIEIRIGVDFFFNYGLLEENKSVGGLETKDSLEALQLVFEHELCHAIEFIYFHKSSCRGDRFKTMAYNLFGHTQSYHQLPTYRSIAGEKLDLKVGDKAFFDYKNSLIKGVIYAINKRATVMVPDKKGRYADKWGNRYTKYYVSLGNIRKM